jgi:hypothetical protein
MNGDIPNWSAGIAESFKALPNAISPPYSAKT